MVHRDDRIIWSEGGYQPGWSIVSFLVLPTKIKRKTQGIKQKKKTHQRALIYLQKMAGANSHFILGKKNLHIFSLKNGAYLCFSN